jgi:glycosyltransferase involved in cell wall biosynthesis
MALRILALEPYYGGSHQAFLDGWAAHSSHQFTLVTLPPFHWKWRMRHAAITMAADLSRRVAAGEAWDILFASDMLNLAEFRGLAPASLLSLPTVAYFHENQLTYPAQEPREWDYHFSFTNFTTALAADQVWFNSSYHRDDFLSALTSFLEQMPDHQPTSQVEIIRKKALVESPGISLPRFSPATRDPGPLRITWAARWEHDKAPEILHQALQQLAAAGVDFRLSVLGQSFRQTPDTFERMQQELATHIDQWGYLESHQHYQQALYETDVFVSTARHEFFGISVVEAIAAGAYPLVPCKLAYPDVLQLEKHPDREQFFYDGCADDLAARLRQLAASLPSQDEPCRELLRESVARFDWSERGPQMDDQLEQLVATLV